MYRPSRTLLLAALLGVEAASFFARSLPRRSWVPALPHSVGIHARGQATLSDAVYDAAGLDGKTVLELKDLCRSLGLKVTGRKADLVARITEGKGAHEGASEPPPARGAASARASEPMTAVDQLLPRPPRVLPRPPRVASGGGSGPRAAPAAPGPPAGVSSRASKPPPTVLSDDDLFGPSKGLGDVVSGDRNLEAHRGSYVSKRDKRRTERRDGNEAGTGYSGTAGAAAAPSPKAFGPSGHDYARWPSDTSQGAADGVDVTKVDALLAARLQAKLKRDFGLADGLRDELEALGVAVHDGFKAWRADGMSRFEGRGEQAASSRPRGGDDSLSAAPKSASGVYLYARSGEASGQGGHVDEAAIEGLIVKRGHAKLRGDFALADDLREELLEVYKVEVNDRKRTWTLLQAAGHPYAPLRGKLTAALLDPSSREDARRRSEVEALLASRWRFKKAGAFRDADTCQAQLRALGVEVDDAELTWRFSEHNAQ